MKWTKSKSGKFFLSYQLTFLTPFPDEQQYLMNQQRAKLMPPNISQSTSQSISSNNSVKTPTSVQYVIGKVPNLLISTPNYDSNSANSKLNCYRNRKSLTNSQISEKQSNKNLNLRIKVYQLHQSLSAITFSNQIRRIVWTSVLMMENRIAIKISTNRSIRNLFWHQHQLNWVEHRYSDDRKWVDVSVFVW